MMKMIFLFPLIMVKALKDYKYFVPFYIFSKNSYFIINNI